MNRKRKDENGQKQKRKNIGIIVAALLVVYGAFVDSFRKFFWKSGKK